MEARAARLTNALLALDRIKPGITRKSLKQIQRLSLLVLFAGLLQQSIDQPGAARQEGSPANKAQHWYGEVEYYSNKGSGTPLTLDWIRLKRLGTEGIDPSSTDSGERLKLGWDKINFQKTGLKLNNVEGLDWAEELLDISHSAVYSIPWLSHDNSTKKCTDGDPPYCIDALFDLDNGRKNPNNPWFFATSRSL